MILYLIRGLPGSGKSTYAEMLVTEGECCAYFEADMFFMNKYGEYIFDGTKLPKAHAWCQNQVRCFLRSGYSVAISNTFTTKKEAQPYLDMAKEYDASVKIIEMTGSYGSIHDVPEHVIENMKKRWEHHDTWY